MEQNSKIKNTAIAKLEGSWVMAAVATLVCYMLGVSLGLFSSAGTATPNPAEALDALSKSACLQTVFALLLLPLSWGLRVSFLTPAKGEKYKMGEVFDGYRSFVPVFMTMFLKQIYVLLWSLLLIVPGIVKYYSYSVTEFIMRENPDRKYNDAIEDSMKMMNGYKTKLFMLDLSLIGWFILSCLTLGIGFFFLLPYQQTCHAEFYLRLKEEIKDDSYLA